MHWRILAAGIAFWVLVPGTAAARVDAQSCGVVSLLDLAELVGREVTDEERQQLAEAYPASEVSLRDIRRAGGMLGIPVVSVAATFDELVKDVRGPKIIHMKAPAHLAVMTRASEEWVQLVDRSRVMVVPRKDVEGRYSGYALMLEQQGHETAGPRLRLDEFHHSFGIAGVGQQVERTFKITNAGDQELAVTVRPAACAGPEASVDKDVLGPGESTDLRLKYVVLYLGNIAASVAVLTNDPCVPVAYVTLHGKVPHDLQASPDRLYVTGHKGQELSRRLTVSGPPEMELWGVSCGKGLFGVQIGEPEVSEDEKKTWHIELTLKPEAFVGKVDDQLSIHTTHPERPLITIPITGETRGDLDAQPRMVFFGFVKPNAEASQDVLVRSRSLEAFQIKKATCEDARVTVGTPKRLEDGRWQVPVSVTTGEQGVVDATVVVSTDVPGEERLKIPVYAHILGQE